MSTVKKWERHTKGPLPEGNGPDDDFINIAEKGVQTPQGERGKRPVRIKPTKTATAAPKRPKMIVMKPGMMVNPETREIKKVPITPPSKGTYIPSAKERKKMKESIQARMARLLDETSRPVSKKEIGGGPVIDVGKKREPFMRRIRRAIVRIKARRQHRAMMKARRHGLKSEPELKQLKGKNEWAPLPKWALCND
jgi:hypothetical protein